MSQVTIPDLPEEVTPAATDLLEISKDPGSFKLQIGNMDNIFQALAGRNSLDGYAGLDGIGLLDINQLADAGTQSANRILALNSMATATLWIDAPSTGITSINGQTGAAQTIAEGLGIDVVTATNIHTIILNATLDDIADVAISSPATGDIIFRSGLEWVALPVSTDGFFLTLSSGVPAWASNLFPLGDLTDVDNSTIATNDLLVTDNGSTWVTRQGIFSGITGLGAQSQTLDMDGNQIEDIDFIALGPAATVPANGEIRLTKGGTILWLDDAATNVNGLQFSCEDTFEIISSGFIEYGFGKTTAFFSDNNIDIRSFIDLTEISDPGPPVADVGRLYVADDATSTELFFRRSTGAAVNITNPTIVLELNELTDVQNVSPFGGQILVFDSSSNLWENSSVSGDISSSAATPGQLTINNDVIVNENLSQTLTTYDRITGIGAQTIPLDMNSQEITNVNFIISDSVDPLPDAGFLRIARTQALAWRDFLGTGNLLLTVNTSDQLTFNGTILGPGEVFLWTADHDTGGNSLLNATFAGVDTGSNEDTMRLTIDTVSFSDANTRLTIQSQQSTTNNNAFIRIPDLPNASFDTFVTINETQDLLNKTLTSPILTTPFISDFTNATHNHEDVVGGGQLALAALIQGGQVVLTDQANTYSVGKQSFISVGGPSGHAAINLIPAGSPDALQLANGDLWYDGTSQQLFARVNSVTVDIGVGVETTWQASRDANGNSLTNLATLAFQDTTPIFLEQNGNNLVITVPDDTAGAGIIIENTDGSIALVNNITAVDQFEARITMNTSGATAIGNIAQFLIPASEDMGGVPVLTWEIERNNGVALTTRPLWRIESGITEYLTLSQDQTWTFNSLATFEDLAQIIFNGVTTTTFPTDTLIALTEGDYITWDAAAPTAPNSIRFTTDDVFELAINNVLALSFSTAQLDLIGKNIVNVVNYGFNSPATATTLITADGDGIQLEIDDTEFFDIEINTVLEYRFGQSIADFNNKILKDISQIDNVNDDTLLNFATAVGSPINFLEIENAVSGSGPILRAEGGQVDIDLNLFAKGTGVVNFGGFALENTPQINDVNENEILVFTPVVMAENHIEILNAADGDGPIIRAAGDDTDIDLNINAEAAGSIFLKHSGGNNIAQFTGDALRDSYLQFEPGLAAGGNAIIRTVAPTSAVAGIDLIMAGDGPLNLTDSSLKSVASILDGNDNTLLDFNVIGSAVNFIQIENNSTALGPTLRAEGQTDVDLNIEAKGTGDVLFNSNVDFTDKDAVQIRSLNLGTPAVQVISGQTIAYQRTFQTVAPSAGTTDVINDITGGTAGDVIILRVNSNSNIISVEQSSTIALTTPDFDLNHVTDILVLIFDGTTWNEVSRADNG